MCLGAIELNLGPTYKQILNTGFPYVILINVTLTYLTASIIDAASGSTRNTSDWRRFWQLN